MIYKIITDFSNLENIIKTFSQDFNILFCNGSLYICSKKLNNVSSNRIKKMLQNDNVFLLEINGENINYESERVKQWCISHFIERDIKNFEKNEQVLLKEYMNVLDDCENKLQMMLRKEDI